MGGCGGKTTEGRLFSRRPTHDLAWPSKLVAVGLLELVSRLRPRPGRWHVR